MAMQRFRTTRRAIDRRSTRWRAVGVAAGVAAGVSLCALAATPAFASAPSSYVLAHPAQERCTAAYVAHPRTILRRAGARTRPVRETVCVHVGSGAGVLVGEIATLLNGIPQSGNALGSPSAPLRLQYFADLECPICREFSLGALPELIVRWVRTGDLRIEFRAFETATREPAVFRKQQVAALAAGRQNRLWQFTELFYNEQGEEDSGYVTDGYLSGIARQVPGLDLGRWAHDRRDRALARQVDEDEGAALRAHFVGTPSFLLGRSGHLVPFDAVSLTDPASFAPAIEKLLHA